MLPSATKCSGRVFKIMRTAMASAFLFENFQVKLLLILNLLVKLEYVENLYCIHLQKNTLKLIAARDARCLNAQM